MKKVVLLFVCLFVLPAYLLAKPQEKEWTFLIFLNGHNDLDRYGAMDINEMEKVGSTDDINVVVQWGSLAGGSTKRLAIEKDQDPERVTSPVVDDMGEPADMGSYESVIDFIEWGVENYPARRYFIDIWDHGSGWRKENEDEDEMFIGIQDISWDEISGNHITTAQLGLIMSEAKGIIGHNVDIYGNDACLMGMVEVAGQVADSVDVFVGSEDYEPVEGWPYDTFLAAWAEVPDAEAPEVSGLLTKTFLESYSGGTQGNKQVALSSFDLTRIDLLRQVLSELSQAFQMLDASQKRKVLQASSDTMNFYYLGYIDLLDFIDLIDDAIGSEDTPVRRELLDQVRQAVLDFVISSESSDTYQGGVHGATIWFPPNYDTLVYHRAAYQELKFDSSTQWSRALENLLLVDEF